MTTLTAERRYPTLDEAADALRVRTDSAEPNVPEQPLTISRAARLLDLPGPTAGARAQLLRRLERRGVVEPPLRGPVTNSRLYRPSQLASMRDAIRGYLASREESR